MSNQKQKKKHTPRYHAIQVLQTVILQGQSLSSFAGLSKLNHPSDRAFVFNLVNGVLRWRWKYEVVLNTLIEKSLRKKDYDVMIVLMMALYELEYCRTPVYAAINEAVSMVVALKKIWAKGLVNAVLRRYEREKENLDQLLTDNEQVKYSQPEWILTQWKKDWPEHWQFIAENSNKKPPVWLRVNLAHLSRKTYSQKLDEVGLEYALSDDSKSAIKLISDTDVSELPGFEQGDVSVQDEGAQKAAELLPLKESSRVLDLCAAPGGKTCHILELSSGEIDCVAVDISETRLQKVKENLARLGLSAQCVVGDATVKDSWWDGQMFDSILLDVPCSASGVIRRHPDIKSLRREEDVDHLVATQKNILEIAWQVLKPGGYLLYVTCSVFARENWLQVNHFLEQHDDASEDRMDNTKAYQCSIGIQYLPGSALEDYDGDGFYFARLKKSE